MSCTDGAFVSPRAIRVTVLTGTPEPAATFRKEGFALRSLFIT